MTSVLDIASSKRISNSVECLCQIGLFIDDSDSVLEDEMFFEN